MSVKHSFKESPILVAIRVVEKNKKELRSAIVPSLAFQKQIQSLFLSAKAIKQIEKKGQRTISLIKDLNRLRDYRHELEIATSFVEKSMVWKNILDIQKNIELSQSVQDALKGIKLSNELISSLRKIQTGPMLDQIILTLNQGLLYVGEYELEEESQTIDDRSELILPERLEERLNFVNYLPVTLYQKILNSPSLLRGVSPRDFEYFIAEIIDKLGFTDVNVTPQSGDGGRDIIATKMINGIKMLFAFECKRYSPERKIQLGTMRALLGTVSHAETKANMGVLVTTSSFTRGSKKLIMSEALIDGKDFDDLVTWINQVKRK